MPLPPLTVQDPALNNGQQYTVQPHSGIITFIGPNGSGKTRALRSAKERLQRPQVDNKKIRYLAASRFGFIDYDRIRIHGNNYVNPTAHPTFGQVDQVDHRHESESAAGDFLSLDSRPDLLLKINTRLRSLFSREVRLVWNGGSLTVRFVSTKNQATYSSSNEASGLLNIVSLLAAIYDDEVGALFIDEPEISLHPQLQAFLLREMQKVAGDPTTPGKKLIVLCTHSTEFISIRKPEDICSMVFFNDVSTSPLVIAPTDGFIQGRSFRSMIVQMGSLEKTAFFSQRPLLVEGPTDLQICAALEQKLDLYLGVAGSQLIQVNGTGNMSLVVQLFQKIGKKPIILTDIDSCADDSSFVRGLHFTAAQEAFAHGAGAASLGNMFRDVHRDFAQMVTTQYADIQAEAEAHDIWQRKDPEKPADLYMRRSVMAVVLNSSDALLEALPNGAQWVAMKTRITAILDVIEKAGCFILRKGYIENYYQHLTITGRNDKVKMSMEEVDQLDRLPFTEVNEQGYDDVIRCLKYASQAPMINEAEAVIVEALTIISPVLYELSKLSNNATLDQTVRRITGGKAPIIRLEADQAGADPVLVVNLSSAILQVRGFPFRIPKNGNPNVDVPANIQMT